VLRRVVDRDIANTLEALANLLYLALGALDNRETADAYLAMAEHIVQTAANPKRANGPRE
jgi:hypothetical protein